MIYIYLLILLITAYFLKKLIQQKQRNAEYRKNYSSYKKVPALPWDLPLIGHGLQLGNLIEFVKDCYHTYGKIFRINIFGIKVTVICDHDLKKEYFKANESQMSLYDVLERLFFVDAFSDYPELSTLNISMVKKTVAVKFDLFAPKIINEANKFIASLKKKYQNSTEKVNLQKEMIKFISQTSSRCFIGYEISDEFYYNLEKFTNLLNKIVVLTYFLPKWFIRKTINQLLRHYRRKMTDLLSPEIEKYRNDPNLNDSTIIRKGLEYVNDNTGQKLTNGQIGDIIVCLLYVSSENTALGLSAAFTDLARNPKHWDIIKDESLKIFNSSNINDVFNSKVIEAAVMESARLNTHMFALNRKPINKKTIGNYYIGDCDTLVLCEPILMKFDNANYTDAETYNPLRYSSPSNESMATTDIMTWGSGQHLCPGKIFAMYEIKAALALLTLNFERPEILDSDMGPINYFSPSAFSERETKVLLKPIENTLINQSIENQLSTPTKEVNTELLDEGGILLRNYFNEAEQINFFTYVMNLSTQDSNVTSTSENVICDNKNEFSDFPLANPLPIAYYNNPYTNGSSCIEPMELIEAASDIIKNNTDYDIPKYNSVYCQLYGPDSILKDHFDEFKGVGVSFSFGASCDFLYGDKIIQLNSGDVLIADFSKVEHGIRSIKKETTPKWLDELNIDTFSRIRLNIQFRHYEPNNNPIDKNEFNKLINK